MKRRALKRRGLKKRYGRPATAPHAESGGGYTLRDDGIYAPPGAPAVCVPWYDLDNNGEIK
jgi:hypothetical protein